MEILNIRTFIFNHNKLKKIMYYLRPKCLGNILFTLLLYFSIIFIDYTQPIEVYFMIMPLISPISNKKLKGIKRIGPHDSDILSIICGSLLGNASAETLYPNTPMKTGSRICFLQESRHLSYILWIHEYLSSRGYCNKSLPKIETILGLKGVVRKRLRVITWTYTSFNFIFDLFYSQGIKKVPINIGEYLTPLALAIWVMDDGIKVSRGLKLNTKSFTYSDCILLLNVLNDNFSLKASIQSAGPPSKFNLYIWKESMPKLREIILPHILPEMKYKILD